MFESGRKLCGMQGRVAVRLLFNNAVAIRVMCQFQGEMLPGGVPRNKYRAKGVQRWGQAGRPGPRVSALGHLESDKHPSPRSASHLAAATSCSISHLPPIQAVPWDPQGLTAISEPSEMPGKADS